MSNNQEENPLTFTIFACAGELATGEKYELLYRFEWVPIIKLESGSEFELDWNKITERIKELTKGEIKNEKRK